MVKAVSSEAFELIEPISKNGFWFKIKAGSSFNRAYADIRMYFEELKREPSAEFGPKDFFEIGSIVRKGFIVGFIWLGWKLAFTWLKMTVCIVNLQ